jgi:maltose O-acetyltransferase
VDSDDRSHKQRMLAGDLYQASDPEVRAGYERAQRLVRALNATAVEDVSARAPVLEALFGSVGGGSDVLPPFQCDYGSNIALGDRVFVNFGAVMLDTRAIELGDDVLVGPGVQLLTADHPLDPDLRSAGWESGRPLVIGDRAWIGAGAIVLPGVTVGTGAVIGAGAVVTRDVPPGAVVAGNPARVVRAT